MTEAIDYDALVEQLTKQLNAMKAEVPFLSEPRKTDLRRLISAAGVPDVFIQHLAEIIRTNARVRAAVHDDPNVTLDQRRAAAALTLIENGLRALADSIHATAMILRAGSGSRALDAYAALQSLLRQPGGMDLMPHVRHLRALLGRGRPRKTTTNPAPEPGE